MECQLQLAQTTARHVHRFLDQAMEFKCNGCSVDHPSQPQHECLMLSGEARIRFCLDQALLLEDWGKVENRFWSVMVSHSFSWQGVVSNSVDWWWLVWTTGVSIIGTRMSVWCITLYCHSRHISHWGFPWAKNITTTGCSSDIPPMLCHSRHTSQRGTGFFLQPKNSTISYKCQHKLFHLQSSECSHHGWTLHGLPFSQPAVHWLTRV